MLTCRAIGCITHTRTHTHTHTHTQMVLLDILTQLVSVHLSQGDISAAGAQVRELMQRLPEEGSGSKEQPGGREAGDARGTQPEGNGKPLHPIHM